MSGVLHRYRRNEFKGVSKHGDLFSEAETFKGKLRPLWKWEMLWGFLASFKGNLMRSRHGKVCENDISPVITRQFMVVWQFSGWHLVFSIIWLTDNIGKRPYIMFYTSLCSIFSKNTCISGLIDSVQHNFHKWVRFQ